MKNKKTKIIAAAISAAAWLWFIFSNSLKSRAQSAEQSEMGEGFVRRILSALGFTGDAEAAAEIFVRKSAHVFEFFVLCFLLLLLFSLAFKNKRAVLALPTALTFFAAATDECLQLISHRGASVRDVLIDSVGAFLAVLLFWLVGRKKSKPEQNEERACR